jgi:formate dehydrogenase subunit gamma
MHPRDTTPQATDGAAATDQIATVDAAIAKLRDLPGALLPIFHEIQARLGYVPPASLPRIAAGLNLSVADVHGVLTFYHDFRTAPPGRHVLRQCRAEACQAMGSERVAEHLRQRTQLAGDGTTADGRLTVETVYCLGNCALAPSALIDGRLYGRVTERRLDELLAGLDGRNDDHPEGRR